MKAGTSELMWARQHPGGNVWTESFARVKAYAAHWPDRDGDEQMPEDEKERFGPVRLFRVTIEPVSAEEQAAYEAQQAEWIAARKMQELARETADRIAP